MATCLLIREGRHVLIGLALALLTILLHRSSPDPGSLDSLGILLGVSAGVYVGFAIADGGRQALAVESVAGLAFFGVALLGMRQLSAPLIALAYFGHGLWDLAHHHGAIRTPVRGWFPPFCLVYDWVVGAYVLAWTL